MDTHTIEAGGLRIAFEYRGDRWEHRIAAEIEGRWVPILATIEGIPENASPPSPAFQDLRLETLGDGLQVFQAMGQAGTRIYSAAVTVDPRRPELDFDVCLRSRQTGSAFSTYAVEPECALRWESGRSARVELPGGRGIVNVEIVEIPNAAAGRMEVIDREGRPALRLGAEERSAVGSAVGSMAGSSRRAQSIRWRYRILRFESA